MQNQEIVQDAAGANHVMGIESNIWTFYTVDAAEDLWAAVRAKLPPRGGNGAITLCLWDYSCFEEEADPCFIEMWIWSDTETCNESFDNYGYILKPDSIAADEPGRWKWGIPYGRFPFNGI